MKKYIYLLLTILLLLGMNAAVLASDVREIRMAGTINNKIMIHMNLTIMGSQVIGTYYYDKYGVDLHLSGQIEDNIITVAEYDPDGNPTGIFKGQLYFDKRLQGTWQTPDGSREYPFYVYTEPPTEEELQQQRANWKKASNDIGDLLERKGLLRYSYKAKINGDYWAIFIPSEGKFWVGETSPFNFRPIRDWQNNLYQLADKWEVLDYQITETGDLIWIESKRNYYDYESDDRFKRKVFVYEREAQRYHERAELAIPKLGNYNFNEMLISQDGRYLIYRIETRGGSREVIRVSMSGEELRVPWGGFISLIPDTYSYLRYYTDREETETVLQVYDYETHEKDSFTIPDMLTHSVEVSKQGEVILQGKDVYDGIVEVTYQLPDMTPHLPDQTYLSQVREFYQREVLPDRSVKIAQGDLSVYQVSTPDELYQAIGSNRIIELLPGRYNLSTVGPGRSKYLDPVGEENDSVWRIHHLRNLTIRNQGEGYVEITAVPANGHVLKFQHVTNLTLEGVSIGHSNPSYLDSRYVGPVLYINKSDDITIKNSVLFAGGTYGLSLGGVKGFIMEDSTITNGLEGMVGVGSSTDLTFRNVVFEENQGESGFAFYTTSNVLIEDSKIAYNLLSETLLTHEDSEGIIFRNTVTHDNGQPLVADEVVSIEEGEAQRLQQEQLEALIQPGIEPSFLIAYFTSFDYIESILPEVLQELSLDEQLEVATGLLPTLEEGEWRAGKSWALRVILRELGDQLLQPEDVEKVTQLFTQMIEDLLPEDQLATKLKLLLLMGEIYWEAVSTEEALEYLQLAESQLILLQNRSEKSRILVDLADFYLTVGEREVGLKYLTQAHAMTKGYALSDTFALELALAYQKAGDDEQVLELARYLDEHNYQKLVQSYLEKGQMEQAENIISQAAIEYQGLLQVVLVDYYLDQGEVELAKQLLDSTLQKILEPEAPYENRYWTQKLGVKAYLKLGEVELALQQAQRVAEDRQISLFKEMAQMVLAGPEPEEARGILELMQQKLFSTYVPDGFDLAELAELYLQLGDESAAVDCLEKAMEHMRLDLTIIYTSDIRWANRIETEIQLYVKVISIREKMGQPRQGFALGMTLDWVKGLYHREFGGDFGLEAMKALFVECVRQDKYFYANHLFWNVATKEDQPKLLEDLGVELVRGKMELSPAAVMYAQSLQQRYVEKLEL